MFAHTKGLFRIVKTSIDTGEVTHDSGWVPNVVTDRFLRVIAAEDDAQLSTFSAFSNYEEVFGPNIVISEWPGPETSYLSHLPDCYLTGTNVTGVPSPSVIQGSNTVADPLYVEYQQTFSPPASVTRNINSIGITEATGGAGTYLVDAYTSLASTCTQTTTEILNVFYRVQFLQGLDSRFWPSRVRQFAVRHTQFGSSVIAGYPASGFTTGTASLIILPLIPPSATPTVLDEDGPVVHFSGANSRFGVGDRAAYPRFDIGTIGTDPENFARTFNYNRGLTQSIGTIFSGVYIGGGADFVFSTRRPSYFYNKLLPEGETKLQNIFSHSSTTVAPFFDASDPPGTTASISVDASGWTNPDYPQNWRIDITTGGAVGVAEYRLKVRRTFGYVNNTYEPRVPFYPHIVGNDADPEASNWWDNREVQVTDTRSGLPWKVYDKRRVFAIDADALVAFDILTLERTIFDSVSFPAFTPTDIGQIEIDELSDTVWVGCRSTGIYSIQDPFGTPTVTFHDVTGASGGLALTNQCYGIDVGADITGQRRVWAIVEGGLVESNDGGTTWAAYDSTTTGTKTFTNTNIETNWASVFFLKADPNPVNDELGIMYEVATNDMRIVWWDDVSDAQDLFSGNVTGLGSLTVSALNARRFHNMFDVSNNDSVWAISSGSTLNTTTNARAKIYTFGQGDAGITSIETPTGVQTNISDLDGTTCRNVFFTRDNTFSDAVLIPSGSGNAFICYVGRTNGSFSEVANVVGEQNFGTLSSLSFWDTEWCLNRCMKAYMGGGVFVGASPVSSGQSPDRIGYGRAAMIALGLSNDPNGGTDADYTVWDTYGWDGSNWVLGNTNSRLTHATSEPLIDGVNISFDDDGATQTYFAGEYFTFGLVDGVWSDGGTEWSHESRIYMKPGRDKVTDFTPGTVPGAAALSTRPVRITPLSVPGGTDGPGIVGSWELETNVVELINNGSTIRKNTSIATISGGRITVVSSGDTYVRFKCERDSGDDYDDILLGLVPSSLLGAAHEDPSTNTNALYAFTLQGSDIIIRESGSNVLTVATGTDTTTRGTSVFEIERVGTTINYYWNGDLVRTTTGVGGGLVPEVSYGGAANDPGEAVEVQDYSATVTDYFVDMSDGVSVGAADTDFEQIVLNFGLVVELDGTPATLIFDDTSTTLAAGEVAVYKSGHVRFAAADAGRAVTGRYTYLRNS